MRDVLVALIENLLAITGENITEEDVLALESWDWAYEYTRQSGKTTTLVHIIEVIMIFISKLFDMPIEIGIFAPQREQANTDFKRLKNALSRTRKDLNVIDHDANRKAKEESNAKTLVLGNGSSCYIFPVTPTSSPESKTLHIIFLEEAQDLIDTIVNEQIMPMGVATNAVIVRVGTAGTQTCDFYWKIQKSEAYVMTYPEIAADRRAMFKATADPRHLIYEQRVQKDVEKYGINDARIQRPYFNVWQLAAGMYITGPELFAGRVNRPFDNPKTDEGYRKYREWYNAGRYNIHEIDEYARSHNISPPLLALYRTWLEQNHYFGLDTAKSEDQTVLKIGREIDGRLTQVRSVGLRGLNYEDQFDILRDELSWFKIAAGSIDSTGQGSFMPDKFKRLTGYKIFDVTFSRQSKDHLYTALYQKQVNNQFAYYWQDPQKADSESYTAKASAEFEDEFLQLQKDYIGEYMVIAHPDEKGAHDDHPDATALLNHAFESYNISSGILTHLKQIAEAGPDEAPPTNYKFRGKPHI